MNPKTINRLCKILQRAMMENREMKNFLKELLSFNLYTGNPIKYRERYSTIAEHEKRLIDEVNGFRKR